MNPDKDDKEASPTSSQSVASSLRTSTKPPPRLERNLDINFDYTINSRQWLHNQKTSVKNQDTSSNAIMDQSMAPGSGNDGRKDKNGDKKDGKKGGKETTKEQSTRTSMLSQSRRTMKLLEDSPEYQGADPATQIVMRQAVETWVSNMPRYQPEGSADATNGSQQDHLTARQMAEAVARRHNPLAGAGPGVGAVARVVVGGGYGNASVSELGRGQIPTPVGYGPVPGGNAAFQPPRPPPAFGRNNFVDFTGNNSNHQAITYHRVQGPQDRGRALIAGAGVGAESGAVPQANFNLGPPPAQQGYGRAPGPRLGGSSQVHNRTFVQPPPPQHGGLELLPEYRAVYQAGQQAGHRAGFGAGYGAGYEAGSRHEQELSGQNTNAFSQRMQGSVPSSGSGSYTRTGSRRDESPVEFHGPNPGPDPRLFYQHAPRLVAPPAFNQTANTGIPTAGPRAQHVILSLPSSVTPIAAGSQTTPTPTGPASVGPSLNRFLTNGIITNAAGTPLSTSRLVTNSGPSNTNPGARTSLVPSTSTMLPPTLQNTDPPTPFNRVNNVNELRAPPNPQHRIPNRVTPENLVNNDDDDDDVQVIDEVEFSNAIEAADDRQRRSEQNKLKRKRE